ncbi:MAG: transketolase family protein [Firmicutes bacterium]|nr:transketolase family protein [Bacillota bacterium]
MGKDAGTVWTVHDANKMTSKEIYGRVLADLGARNDKIVGLTADLAKSTNIGIFGDRYPHRMFNVGVAEQNMFGIAAGLAATGLIPFASTFATFASLRAAEQVRTDIAYQNLPVKIIATHSGLSFGTAGTTHHATEDLAVMRSLANMTVVVPADGWETAKAVRACVDLPGPFYMRVGRGFEPPLHENEDFEFTIGKAMTVKDGSDITVITCGIPVLQAKDAARELEQDGISVRVINMHTIKPIDREIIVQAVLETRRIVTVEEHNIIGGLGDAVASVIAESGKACAFTKIGIPDEYSVIGFPEDLYARYRLDSTGIVETVRELLGKEIEADEDWTDED